jgi:hypothetical protein
MTIINCLEYELVNKPVITTDADSSCQYIHPDSKIEFSSFEIDLINEIISMS